MIDEGVTAPGFELPALVEGDHRQVALGDYLGEDVVVLAFYPADFNPGCDVESDLDQLDLFTMQPDVNVLAVGPDTLYAHEAFADEYELKIPLLADTRREVAEAYDVAYEDGLGQYLVARAVFVLDHDGEIVYAWSSRDPSSLANVDEIKDALGDTGGDDTAFSRYRVGHAHYVEGRRAFTAAMEEYGNSEWMMAQSDFHRARDEFEEAEEQFMSAARFVDSELPQAHYDVAKEKVTALWQAADWLARSASEYSSGAGSEGQQLRDDAERPLEEARALAEPYDPDAWPPEEPPPEPERPTDEGAAFKKTEEDEDEPAALGVDIDDDAGDIDDAVEEGDDGATVESDAVDATDAGVGAGSPEETSANGEGTAEGSEHAAGTEEEPPEADIDDAELAEIEAEIAANNPDDPLVDEPPEERRSVVDAPPGGENGGDEADGAAIEDDLTDADGGSASLEPDAGEGSDPASDGDAVDSGRDDVNGEGEEVASAGEAEEGGDEKDEGGDAGDEDEVELEEIAPESTSLDGIPSTEDLEGEDASDEESDATDDADAGDA